jgi:hypothetical protein
VNQAAQIVNAPIVQKEITTGLLGLAIPPLPLPPGRSSPSRPRLASSKPMLRPSGWCAPRLWEQASDVFVPGTWIHRPCSHGTGRRFG